MGRAQTEYRLALAGFSAAFTIRGAKLKISLSGLEFSEGCVPAISVNAPVRKRSSMSEVS